MRGGSEASEPFCRVSKATSMVLDYGLVRYDMREATVLKGRMQYLAILKLEDERGLGASHGLADDLGRNPALGGIRLPRSRADIVVLCHLETRNG